MSFLTTPIDRKSIFKISLSGWLITLVLFIALLIFVANFTLTKIFSSLETYILLLIVIAGIILFLVMIISGVLTLLKKSDKQENIRTTPKTIRFRYAFKWLLIFILSIFIIYEFNFLFSDSFEFKSTSVKTNNVSLTPTIIPTVESNIPTSQPKQNVYYVQPTTDPDPFVECKSNLCNGGMIRQSECTNSTCCGFNNGIWIFYKDKNKCLEDQKAQNSGSNNSYNPSTNYTYPTFAPIPTYSYPTYQPYASPTLTENQAQTIIDQHNSQVQQCKSNVISNGYDDNSISVSCSNLYGDTSAREACIQIKENQRNQLLSQCGSTY